MSAKLLEELPMWKQLGAEVALSGFEISEWMKSQNKIVPKELAQEIFRRS